MRTRLFKRNLKRTKIRLFIIFFSIISIAVFCVTLQRLYPNYIARVEIYSENLANDVINATLSEVIKNGYDGYIFDNIYTNENNDVKSIRSDTLTMNSFKTEFTEKLQKKLSSLPDGMISIPLGSLLKNEIFSGFGPKIKIKVVANGHAKVNFSKEFEAVGINQIRQQNFLDISVSITVASATMRNVRTVKSTVPISENIISGTVPNYYGGKMNFSATE